MALRRSCAFILEESEIPPGERASKLIFLDLYISLEMNWSPNESTGMKYSETDVVEE